ncbi:centrosomal of 70 kDa [Pelobates cultripes]|uniref:Centrosomal protein of 70 kDa n=1 Tax=Pelobates cultripes TaxID=61616 RepID=A0AAD1WGN3_PELCU|nr:centrosomal of 70 kDa [Pelobates cultripes]
MDSTQSLDAEDARSKDTLTEWTNTNKLLKQHGCTPICVTKPRSRDGMSGAVLLDVQASVAVQSAVKMLVDDTERRQNLIHDLIKANEQLKEDVRLQQSRAERHEQKASALQNILDSVKTKIRNLEDDFIAKTRKHQMEMSNLLKEKQVVLDQCRSHREKFGDQEEQISKLRFRLSQAESSREQQLSRQRKVFIHLVRRAPKENNTLDQQILDIIDGYEQQVAHLQRELRLYKVDNIPVEKPGSSAFDDQVREQESSVDIPVREPVRCEESLDLDATPNYKALLKSYQDQVKDANRKLEQLVRENSQIRDELASRPTVREFKHCKQQIRKLETILVQNNISFRKVIREKNTKQLEQPLNTCVQNLDQLPASECRQYLQGVCTQLNVQDLKDLISTASSKSKQAETCAGLRKILCEIRSILGGPRAPQLLYKCSFRQQETRGADPTDDSDFLHLPPTIEMWAGQLLSLKTLLRALRKLSETLMPNHPVEESHAASDAVRVEELLLLVDTMMEDAENRTQDTLRISPHTLQALVSHFQKLFDVPSLSGVYPRMNEVYCKLGETSNMMKNLQCILGTDDKVSCGELVNVVWQLCREVEEGDNQKLQEILGTLDIDSVINKIQEHEDFFPAFEGLIKELLDVLGICQLGEILPEVQRLKALASPSLNVV